MKHFFLLLILSVPILFTACKDDEPEIDISAALHYDEENFAAPELDPGTHLAGVFFPASMMATHSGKNLEEVLIYFNNVPTSCSVQVYRNGLGDIPGQSLYNQNISSQTQRDSWNFHTLSTPVPLTGEAIWVVVRFTHDELTSTVGCDPGPAFTNGDWILTEGPDEWITLRERTNDEVDINWNIRARVSE